MDGACFVHLVLVLVLVAFAVSISPADPAAPFVLAVNRLAHAPSATPTRLVQVVPLSLSHRASQIPTPDASLADTFNTMPAQAIKALGGLRNHKRQGGQTDPAYLAYISSLSAQQAGGGSAMTITLPGQKPQANHSLPAAVPSSLAAAPQPAVSSAAAPPAQSSSAARPAPPSSSAAAPKPVATSSPAATTSHTPAHNTPVPPPSPSTTTKPVAQTTAKPTTSAKPSATPSGAAAGSGSKGVSNGGIAGIVIALIIGIIVLGSLAGWMYRKHKQRQYNKESSWAKMDDDDITPFPSRSREPKPVPYRDDDGYGSGNGNSRALALARQNAFYTDGTPRPESGVPQHGGAARSYGPYPVASSVAASRSYSPNSPQSLDYPYIQNGGYPSVFAQQQEQNNPFSDSHVSPSTSPTNGTRQLVGPGVGAYGGANTLAPVPLGRPQAPNSYDDIASAEMYADDRYADDHLPAPPQIGRTAAYDDFDPENYSPRTAASNEWAGGAVPGAAAHVRTSDVSNVSQLPEPTPLPALRPMSPLMGGSLGMPDDKKTIPAKAFAQSPAQALTETYPDEKSRQMYAEVARYAGVATPKTPATPAVVDGSSPLTSPMEQPQIMQASRLPAPPYQHGQPLSPLTEVSTPKSSNVPLVPSVETHAEAAPTHRRLPTPPRIAAPGAPDDAYDGI